MAVVLGACLLYTSDAADERSSVDLGGRRIIKKKKHAVQIEQLLSKNTETRPSRNINRKEERKENTRHEQS